MNCKNIIEEYCNIIDSDNYKQSKKKNKKCEKCSTI